MLLVKEKICNILSSLNHWPLRINCIEIFFEQTDSPTIQSLLEDKQYVEYHINVNTKNLSKLKISKTAAFSIFSACGTESYSPELQKIFEVYRDCLVEIMAEPYFSWLSVETRLSWFMVIV